MQPCAVGSSYPDVGRRTSSKEAVVFLASDDAANIQGTELVVDGGMTGSPSGAPIYR